MNSPHRPAPVLRWAQAITSWLGGLLGGNRSPQHGPPPPPAPPRPAPPQPSPTPPAGRATPPAARTLVGALGARPDVLDPHRTATDAGRTVLGNVYDTLTASRPEDLAVQPSLASGWSTSADGLQWRFTIRTGVTFHDGSPLDSADVVYSLNRIPGQGHAGAARLAPVVSVAADGPSTVVITLKTPTAGLPGLLASTAAAILPQGAAEQHDLTTTAVGTGPFRLVSSDAVHTVLQAFDRYWGGRPAIGGVELRHVPDPAAALTALRGGQVQWTDNIPAEQIAALRSDPAVHLETAPSVDYWYLTMNFARKPFDNLAIRRAVAYAINADLLVTAVLHGAATANQTAIPKGSFYFVDHSPHPADPTTAKQLFSQGLQQEGYAGVATLPPLRLTLSDASPDGAQVARTIAQMVAQVLGISLRVETLDAATLLDRELRRDFEVLLAGSSGSLDPADFYQARHATGGSRNYQGYSNPQVDRLLQQGATTTDPDARKQAYTQAATTIADDVSYAYLYNTDVVQAWAPGLTGYRIRADRAVRFGGVTLP